MNKRDFLKTTGSILAGAAIARHVPGQSFHDPAPAQGARTNWAGNYTFGAVKVDEPAAAADVPGLLAKLPHAKALGARHSFNNIADSTGDQISLVHLNSMTLDRAAQTVTVGAGVKYGQLAPWLDQQGFAVHNLASLPHVTVVGACATGTHGSGIHNGCLSTQAVAFDFVDGNGQVHTVSRAGNPDEFPGMVVAMGALGVITSITLHVIPTFQIAQVVYQHLAFEQLEHNFDAIMGSGYSVSFFTDWAHDINQVWLKQTAGGNTPAQGHYPAEFYGAKLQTRKLHPIEDHDATPCTEQQGIPGPWYERLPHFRMNFTPSSGAELQTEYFVPREHAYQAIMAVRSLHEKITPHLFITELRCIAADDLWMSMAYKQDSLAIHFTWKPEWDAVRALLPQIQAKLEPFKPRPHWAKLNTIPAAKLKAVYPHYEDFRKLMAKYDPQGKFRNAYLENVFPG